MVITTIFGHTIPTHLHFQTRIMEVGDMETGVTTTGDITIGDTEMVGTGTDLIEIMVITPIGVGTIIAKITTSE